jgi:hypothetical protein
MLKPILDTRFSILDAKCVPPAEDIKTGILGITWCLEPWDFGALAGGDGVPVALIPRNMITGFAPRIPRDQVLRVVVFFLRVASLGMAVGYAVVGR